MQTSEIVLFVSIAAIPTVLLFAEKRGENPAAPTPAPAKHVQTVSRGEYLVRFGGCADCHTPKKMTAQGPVDDQTLWLAGHPEGVSLPKPELKPGPWFAATAGMTAWTGPWGITYAANLTPDEHTGLGIWTEEMFINSMRTGKHMGSGRPILPPMPWQAAGSLTDEDLKAIYAYLRSIPAVKNRVPAPIGPNGETFE